ncbi:MAG: hypothetical protein K2H29_06470 [Oscillospiraceae bacterium]|nr:hypothetical protein [Oscillospiraceae bacterium]
MRGKIKIYVKNKHITFSFTLERNVTVITGDSGTGKTKLINMVRHYSELGKSSGVTLRCDKTCIVLEGRNWEQILADTHNNVVFVEESTLFLTSKAFAQAIKKSDNYYVLVTREPLSQIPYSIDCIKQIIKNNSKPKLDSIYKNIRVKEILGFPYDIVITEDSKSGFQLFTKATEKHKAECISAGGKSRILPLLNKYTDKKILVIADAAALGSEIRELVRFREISNNKIDFFLPESFEWLILKSAIFAGNNHIKNILTEPVDYIESQEFFSWEQFFTSLLVEKTKNSPQLQYPANKSKLPAGYQTAANIESIINAMKK